MHPRRFAARVFGRGGGVFRYNRKMTRAVYWEDSELRELDAEIVAVRRADGATMFAADRTIFYPTGGGQPGDDGEARADGKIFTVSGTIKDADGTIWHCLENSEDAPSPGTPIHLALNWTRRRRMMRAHTAMHLLCAAADAPVTGGQMGELRGRIDFDRADPFDREELARQMNEWGAADLPVSARWADAREVDDNPRLVRTRAVSPPRTAGKIRLVQIGDVDLQTCGGTHLPSTGEIGEIQIVKTEKKGRANRRVVFQIADDS